jgi:hypothetical protein
MLITVGGGERMLINDPARNAKIDVTGWDLDFLADEITKVQQDALVGSDRLLTLTEAVAILEPGTYPEYPLYVDDPWVLAQADRWGEIIAEAIFQRDLPLAMAAKISGREMNIREQTAWETYLREIVERGD